jgi:X-X-X-Leu-X-X-Gly heptad repeat protein
VTGNGDFRSEWKEMLLSVFIQEKTVWLCNVITNIWQIQWSLIKVTNPLTVCVKSFANVSRSWSVSQLSDNVSQLSANVSQLSDNVSQLCPCESTRCKCESTLRQCDPMICQSVSFCKWLINDKWIFEMIYFWMCQWRNSLPKVS